MEDTGAIFFKNLQDLNINYREQDPSIQYLDIRHSVKIEQAIGYETRPKNYIGVFHCALSVQVLSARSSNYFIPFVFVHHKNEEKRKIVNEWVEKSIKNKLVKYNYTEFFDDVRVLINNCKPQLEVVGEFSNITFKSQFSVKKSRYIISDIRLNSTFCDDNNGIDQNNIVDAINTLLINNGDGADFVNLISDLYNKNDGLNELHFAIYGFDGDYKTGHRLTHFFIVAEDNNEIKDFCVQNFHGGYIRKIRDVASYIRTRYIYDLIQKNICEATRSAKAAIMSRNMSHNLGSHVMFYIKQKLQSVSKIVNNNVLHNIIPGNLEDINIKTITDKIAANKDVELPFLVGLGRFINYLQERQDYIATVATNYIPARSTISFKDFIYDELKPDLRHKRHHPIGDGADAGWQPKNLLLDYIAYSEGYTSSDKIEIKFGDFDGNTPPTGSDGETHFQALREFNVAVPGGVIGRQAIFSIVENIIRNAAKHSEHSADGKLVIGMSLVAAEDIKNWGEKKNEKGTNMFRCQRTENSEESGAELAKLYADEKHKNKFHYLRIKVDMPNKSEDIDAVVEKLGESYIEEGGGMKDSSKGLKEMRISAAWLRGHSIDTGIPTEEPPVLAVYSEKYKDSPEKETLSYILCIPKPCKVAFVVDKELLTYVDANNNKASYMDLNPALEPLGCAVFGYDDEAKQLNKKEQNDKEQGKENKYQISEIADYEIVCMLLDDKQKNEKVNSILPYISSRHITNGETTKAILETLKNASDKKSAIDSIYEYWFKDKFQESSSKLMVADAKANTDNKKAKSPLSEDSSVVLSTTGSIVSTAQGSCANSVVYSTHFKGLNHTDNVCDVDNLEELESKEKKNAEYNQWLSNAACIESITGNNSTDRLIRQDEWTKEWKYKHLSAGLARVAIFDERIFSTFVKKETIITKEIVEAIKRTNPNNADEVLLNKYKDKDIIDDIDAGDIVNNPECIDQFIPEGKNDSHTYDIAQKNYERRIWAFNIEADKNLSDTINILGYDAKVGDNINWTDNNTNKPPVVIATLKAENGKYDIKLSEEDTNIFPDGKSQIFDYITIHQGILDKIYNVFGIKENTEDNRKKKLEVTNALHCYFSRHNAISNEATNFLPNFIIHSGRSKPNEQDMPQHQPFVQFAAVDHAVKDCKYTLVELLATAHYEDNNNN